MPAYVIFDVEISDAKRYQEFVSGCLRKGRSHVSRTWRCPQGHEGDWEPRRIVLLKFPSITAWESFYNGPTYQGLKSIRDACSSARLVSVEGLG
jgi:uncharacterized protein (DUF1330 family)